jgi:hypothetical protein
MTADSRFIWDGLTLRHQAVLRGTSLEPRRALLRVQQARDKDEVAASDDCSDGDLDFEQSLMRIGMTGAFLPYTITGDVRAKATSEGLVVTATTSLGTLLGGLGLSLVTITIFFQWAKLGSSTLYWIWLGLAMLATGVHVWQAAIALRRMTDAALAHERAA